MKIQHPRMRRPSLFVLAIVAAFVLTFSHLTLNVAEAESPVAPVPVKVIIKTVADESNDIDPDTPPDFYPRVRIDEDNDFESKPRIDDNAHISPNWEFMRVIDATIDPFITIDIEIWDFDTFGTGDDQQTDISPTPGTRTLTLTLDVMAGTWTGENLPANPTYAKGDFHEEQGSITFDIITPWSGPDSDGDGLLDDWEKNGYDADGDGTIDVNLPAMGAKWDHKDIFIELDWVDKEAPKRAEIQKIKDAFAIAPLTAGSKASDLPGGSDAPQNPDGKRGITVHFDTGSLVDPTANEDGAGPDTCGDGINNGGADGADGADPDCLVGENLGGGNMVSQPDGCDRSPSFYLTRNANFSPARKWIFHYMMSAKKVASCASGGNGEIGGNDFIEYRHDGGTIMHELGHNLNLHHGGADEINCKPNYVSVMNYDNQRGIYRVDGTRMIDYSPARITPDGSLRGAAVLPTLRENALDDGIILDPNDNQNMFVFPDPNGKNKVKHPLNQAADWNNNKSVTDTLPAMNIDNSIEQTKADGTTSRSPARCTNSTTDETLKGHDDWSTISLPFRQFGDAANAEDDPGSGPEPTQEELDALDASFTVVTEFTQVRADSIYGDTTGTFTAILRETTAARSPVVGAVVTFTLNGQAACGVVGTPACPTTNTRGVASFVGAVPAGLNAGTYRNAVAVSYAGSTLSTAAQGSGPLVVARRILWVKPTDRTVGLKQPNPPTTPPAGCVAQQTATSACWVELARGNSFVNGDDWADLGLTNLRFQYARNPPSTNATETVGKTYRITAFGVTSSNYDIRYDPGTLTVK